MVLQLQQEHGCPLSRHHAFTVAIKRLADFRSDHAQASKSRVSDSRERVRTTRKHDAGLPGAQKVAGVCNCVIPRCASSGNHHCLAGKSKLHRYMTGHNVARITSNELPAYFPQFVMHIVIIEALDELRFARGCAPTDTRVLQVDLG